MLSLRRALIQTSVSAIVDRTVLIDDSEIDLFIQRRFLEVYSFTNDLIAFKSAQEAIDALRQRKRFRSDIISWI